MGSRSLSGWNGRAQAELDELEAAHAAVGGAGPGRRTATQQINHAYAVMLSSQFQRFCRDLHTEVADYLAGAMPAGPLRGIFRESLTRGRKLDSGNPNPGNLGSDFGRFGTDLWAGLILRNPRNSVRQEGLERLSHWRNAIAHHDFTSPRLGGKSGVRLAEVRNWRAACNALANELDGLLAAHVATIVGTSPW